MSYATCSSIEPNQMPSFAAVEYLSTLRSLFYSIQNFGQIYRASLEKLTHMPGSGRRNYFRVDVNLWPLLLPNNVTYFFILLSINFKVLLILHTIFSQINLAILAKMVILLVLLFLVTWPSWILNQTKCYCSEVLESDHAAYEIWVRE